MKHVLLSILISMTTLSGYAQQPLKFNVIVQRPSAAVDVTPRAPNTGTTPAADTSELLKKRGEVIQSDGYTLVFCTASWCGPCRSFKSSNEYTRIRGRMSVEIADIDKYPAWRSYARRVPTFWLIRKSDRVRLKSWEGSITLTQIEAAIESQSSPQASSTTTMTYRELVELHNRLHNQASGLNTTWSWLGDIRTLLRTVHGVAL